MDRARELEHLKEALRHAAEGEQRVADRRRRIGALERDGHDTARSKELLRVLEESLMLNPTIRLRFISAAA